MRVALHQESGRDVVELTLNRRQHQALLRHLEVTVIATGERRGLLGLSQESRVVNSLCFARPHVSATDQVLIEQLLGDGGLCSGACSQVGLRLTTTGGFQLRLGRLSIGSGASGSLLLMPSDPSPAKQRP
jgi:hypothetical protein